MDFAKCFCDLILIYKKSKFKKKIKTSRNLKKDLICHFEFGIFINLYAELFLDKTPIYCVFDNKKALLKKDFCYILFGLSRRIRTLKPSSEYHNTHRTKICILHQNLQNRLRFNTLCRIFTL